MENTLFVYVTVSDHAEAEKIGRAIVEARLAACVNILGPITSLYWWKEKIEHSQEHVLVAKTVRDRSEELIGKIKELHSYEVPEIIALPIIGGNQDYLEWRDKEVK